MGVRALIRHDDTPLRVGSPSMQYRLRTLLILLAVGPPAFGLAALNALSAPAIGAGILAWSVVFVVACLETEPKQTHLGFTAAEWLVIAAILCTLAIVTLPVYHEYRQ
jgi:hypothetical protein